MSTFIFNDFSLHANEFSSNSIIKEVNLLIRFSHSSVRIALSALKAVLEKVDEYTVTVDNAELIDSELIITQETIINFHCGERILSYAYRDDKSGFIYLGYKTINRDDIIEGNKLKIKAESEKEIIRAKEPIRKATEPNNLKAEAPEEKNNTKLERMISMKNQFIFNNSNLRNKSDSNVLVNSINKIIRHKTPDFFIPYIELKTLLQNFAAPAVLNNAYRGKEYGENDFDLYITEATTINVYCGFTIYIYKFRIGEINKSGFCYIAEKSIDPIIPDDSHNITEEPSKPTNEPEFVKAAKSFNPKPEPEIDMMTRLSKMHDYFEINRIFTCNFDRFIDASIASLTDNLMTIRDAFNTIRSSNNLLGNLTAEEIDKYIKPFNNLTTLIDIRNPEEAAYMIKSAFNAMLIAHMDARLNNEDEDLHIEYSATK